jgi:hypothetical protein
MLAELYKWAAFQGHVPAGFNLVRVIPRRTRARSRHHDHLDEYEAAALLEAMFELEGAITPRITSGWVTSGPGARSSNTAGRTGGYPARTCSVRSSVSGSTRSWEPERRDQRCVWSDEDGTAVFF